VPDATSGDDAGKSIIGLKVALERGALGWSSVVASSSLRGG
jgi:hypothetical protein